MALPASPKRRRIEGKSNLQHLLSILGSDAVMDVLLSLQDKGVDVESTVRDVLRGETEQSKCKLFVRSLDWSTKPEQVREVFQQYGNIIDLVVLEKDGKSRGFGFVTFSNAEEAASALEEPRKIIDGRETICNLASQPDDRARSAPVGSTGVPGQSASQMSQDQKDASRLFVRSLNWNTDQETLRAAFEVYGEVIDCAVIYDKDTGKSKGYGFVTFADPTCAKEALRQPEKEIDGRRTFCNLASERKRASSMMTTGAGTDPSTSAYYQNLAALGLQGPQMQQYLQQVQQQQLGTSQYPMQQNFSFQSQAGVNQQAASTLTAYPSPYQPAAQQWATTQVATPGAQNQNYALLLQQQQAYAQQQLPTTGIQAPTGVAGLGQTAQAVGGLSTQTQTVTSAPSGQLAYGSQQPRLQ